MSDDDLENDELEVGDDETDDSLDAAAVEDGPDEGDDGGDDAPVKVVKGKAKAAVSVDELPSVEAKNKERDALARAMEEFLAKGGKVQEVEANVVADPPKKPDNKYGSRPI
ncbi:transcriptional regulator SutA [Pseudomonas sp. 1152_12]|uniref:transcriptional regulator SutA n=1 Tax=Pseudomonas sp. 1152_12 TaxID=2604455 RepID=UPI004062A283